ncbi:Cation efflux family transporter [Pseudomonas sp. 8AS]|uniref:cation diffusion facilitator family transporter n=1 Tax=Pseudomonas sp. 8AS TaxID=2653163 RepID=UPI0012F3EE47|nr:cation transporter [Pseudomonas sp. 8AS]VXC15159.1 Cation efflux family transporter [Pseudomonas sp. 8AS]
MNISSAQTLAQRSGSEQRLLKLSILLTLLLAGAGIGFGLYAGSQSIVFDGLFNAIDASMAALALLVARLVVRQPGRRFQQGYWHIEPLVLALYGSVLVMLCAYALVDSLAGLMHGGRALAFDGAIVYALLSGLVSMVSYAYLRRCNRRIDSDLIQLDLHSWLMSSSISLALLLAFTVGWWMQGSEHAQWAPYIDPLVLALLSLLLMPLPCRTVVRAIRQVLRMTPGALDEEIVGLMQRMSQRYGFERFSHCAVHNGRGLFVELHILLPATMDHWSVSALDGVRSEIAAAIGREGPNRWLAIAFTRDGRWL